MGAQPHARRAAVPMAIAIEAAKFTPDEANALRRAMATFRHTGTIHRFYTKMVDGMAGRGYDRDFAERCFRQIEGLGAYGFPESHAATFATLVYVSAWLKCHHPAAFACALLNSQPMGFYASTQIVQRARARGNDPWHRREWLGLGLHAGGRWSAAAWVAPDHRLPSGLGRNPAAGTRRRFCRFSSPGRSGIAAVCLDGAHRARSPGPGRVPPCCWSRAAPNARPRAWYTWWRSDSPTDPPPCACRKTTPSPRYLRRAPLAEKILFPRPKAWPLLQAAPAHSRAHVIFINISTCLHGHWMHIIEEILFADLQFVTNRINRSD
jgi:hypothetical protein